MLNNTSLQALKRRGALTGVISSLIGCFVFIAMEEIRMMISIGHEVDLKISFLIFLLGAALAVFPAGGGGMLLASLLFADANNQKLSMRRALLLGSLLGSLAGIFLMLIGGFLANWRGSADLFLLHTIEIVSVAILAGGLTGTILAKNIFQMRNNSN